MTEVAMTFREHQQQVSGGVSEEMEFIGQK
jgi:hypothetical protein